MGAATTVGLAGCIGGDNRDGEFPSDNIRHIIPYGEGGGSDTYARGILPQVGEELGVDVQLENIPGAESIQGITEAYYAEPDGYTHVGHTLPTAGIAWLLNQTNDDLSQLKGICQYGQTPYVIFANPDEEIEGMEDLADRYEDGDLTQFGGSLGAANHVAMIQLREEGDVPWEDWIVYDGSGPTVQAAASGEIPVGTATDSSAAGAVEEGNIDIVGVLTSDGSSVFPDTSTTEDAGWTNVDEFGAIMRTASCAPDTPDDRVQTLADAYEAAINSDEVQEWSEETGNEVLFNGPDETNAAIESAFSIDEQVDLGQLQ
ncbi:tripartite tricarboxylate transporter substrate binding protein (plasmid) [Natrinema zhouii]|uniref:Bug family tripartite tricarboxylate transporter substrate binding protein n=1 Tax=Natrinema zhouii TaxID=1710539 RepID=UPI001D0008D2|nr:tripartite tricarboxylate transporter substrate-binding protein [Natrinema zhouii]UHQ98880.1 tripartite tricarboxylate transporter substrate binding protein [Natrinema zhouii]